MFKKSLGLILVLFLLMPSMVKANSMFEENFKREQKKLKSESAALLGSLAATAIPSFLGWGFLTGNAEEFGLALTLSGLIAGPSMGHFYANQKGRGFTGIGIRLAIILGGYYLTSEAIEEQHPDSELYAAIIGIIAVGSVTLVHGIYDILTTPSSVRRYNESLKNKKSLRLVPEVDPYNESYGLSIVYNF